MNHVRHKEGRPGSVPDAVMTGRTARVVVLISKPIQHFAPGLRLLAAREDVSCQVYYWDATTGQFDNGFGRRVRWNADLHSGYEWWSPATEVQGWRRCVAVARRLREDRPDVLLCFGWAGPIARTGILFAAATRTPLLYYGDSNWRGSPGSRRSRIRRTALRNAFRMAAGAVSTGTFNREFYIAHGMDPALIHPGVYPSDVELFHAAAERRRKPVGDGGPLVIGFVGKFLPEKAPEDVVEAVTRLGRDLPWQLWLVGDGPTRSRLEALVAERGLADRVRFLGFRNCDELPAIMSAIDVMVMPSRREPRGLVPIEGMAAGATAVVSSATGAWGPGDAVQHGETGLVYRVGDIDALAACLRRLMDDPVLRQRLATAGQARALRLGPRDFADLAARAVVAATNGDDYVPTG